MEREIANLRVVVTDDDSKPSGVFSLDKKHFLLYLNPNYDKPTIEKMTNKKATKRDIVSIIAHELGHFVAYITGDKTHDDFVQMMGIKVPGEIRAWEIGKKIYPATNPVLLKAATNSYKENSL